MSDLRQGIERAIHALDNVPCRWALVGGLAVSVRAEPRLTRDIDFAVAVASDAEAERILLALQRSGYALRMLLEQSAVCRLSTARLRPTAQDDNTIVDLLFASSGIEVELVAAAEPMEVLPNLTLPVAATGHLLALKMLACDDRKRPQDRDDIRALLTHATVADLDVAKQSLVLIEARGYHRGRTLSQDFAALLHKQD
ncbi:MAG: nucleotidyl transferase AbiEii/AbiGii toxin family protein [Polyangiales bacterium]